MRNNGYVSELRQLIRLASPLLVAHLLTTAISTVDTLMSGRYHANDLAAVAIGNSIWLPASLLISGLLIASTSMVARFHGARDQGAIVTTVQQSTWLSLAVALPVMLLLLNVGPLLEWLQVDGKLRTITRGYLSAIATGVPAMALFSSLRSFSEGMGRTRPFMSSSCFVFLLNIPLNYALIYGRWGMPELGGVGCGWATAICLWLHALIMIGFTSRCEYYEGVAWYRHWQRPRWSTISHVLQLGAPIALAVVAEASIFSTIALLLSPLGATVVAGHQIALTVSHIIFMIPLALSQAITIRVGHFLGRGDQGHANFVVRSGFVGAALVSLSTASLILLLRETIVGWFSTDHAVQALAMGLFFWMALYQIPDQLQITANAALRAYQDSHTPLLLILFSYWGVALPLGFVLARTDWLAEPLAAEGFWMALVAGLSMTCLLLGSRLFVVARRPVHTYQG